MHSKTKTMSVDTTELLIHDQIRESIKNTKYQIDNMIVLLY